jgi:molecular chaperone GrpE
MMAKDNEAIRPEDLEWVPASREAEGAAVEAKKEHEAAGADELPPLVEQKIKEAAEAQEKYLRTYADFENYRKRTQRDLAEFRKYANEQFAAELLTVVDHLGLALKHAAEAGETGQGLREGVELVYKQVRDVLEKYGIKPFASEGEKFDPAKHDAVMQEATDRVPENTVVQVFQEGYLYHDKVLRHAKVGVAKKPASPEHKNKTE